MGHSSTNFNTRNASEELTWYYVQPGFKLITPIKFFLAVLAFVLILVLLALLNPQLVLDSYWTLLIVPLDALFVGWMLLMLQPHRQIYYRLDSEGVSSEFRSTASPLAGLVSFLLGTFCTMIGLKKSLYLNNHSSRSRVLDWGEIVSVQSSPNMRRIVLQAGLHGQLTLWTNAENFNHVLTLVKTYIDEARKHYD